MTNLGHSHWRTLYREAVLEPDQQKLRSRIAKAQHAIRQRARELWYHGTEEEGERHRLDAASQSLGILCAIGKKS